MGDVYLARDLTLERDVAIKLLPADGRDHDDTRGHLLREAQAAAALDHPNICHVHEVGQTDDGRAFIVMQYVEGETLSAVLRRGPMPVRTRWRWVRRSPRPLRSRTSAASSTGT